MKPLIIKYADGPEMEVTIQADDVRNVASTNLKAVQRHFTEEFRHLLNNILMPIQKELETVAENFQVDTVAIQVGVKAGIEGNLIICKGTAESNLSLTINVKKKTLPST